MTLGPGEQIRAIIGIEYVGADQVQRYLADLQRLGAITEASATRISNAWQGASAGVLSVGRALREITDGLNQSETAARRLERQLEGVAFGRNEAALRSYNNQLGQLDRLSRQAAGGLNTLASARQRLASVFATNLGALAHDVQQGPVAVGAARRPLELTATASAQPATVVGGAMDSERRMQRIYDLIEAQERRGNTIRGGQYEQPFASERAGAEFQRLNPALEQTRQRFEAVSAALAGLHRAAGGRPSADDPRLQREARDAARTFNRAQLTSMAAEFGGTGGNDYNDALNRWSQMQPRAPHDWRLLTSGELSATHARQNPDLMRGLFQSDPKELTSGIGRGGTAAVLPGMTNPDAVIREWQAEYDAAMARNIIARTERMHREAIRVASQVGATALPQATTSQVQGRFPELFGLGGQTALESRGTVEDRARQAALRQAQEAQRTATQYRLSPIDLAMWGSVSPGYQLEAMRPGVPHPVGQMQWRQDTGEIASMVTHPQYYRQGVATGLWGHSQGLEGVTRPVHSDDRTVAGDAWIRSLSNNVRTVDQVTEALQRLHATSRSVGDRLPVPRGMHLPAAADVAAGLDPRGVALAGGGYMIPGMGTSVGTQRAWAPPAPWQTPAIAGRVPPEITAGDPARRAWSVGRAGDIVQGQVVSSTTEPLNRTSRAAADTAQRLADLGRQANVTSRNLGGIGGGGTGGGGGGGYGGGFDDDEEGFRVSDADIARVKADIDATEADAARTRVEAARARLNAASIARQQLEDPDVDRRSQDDWEKQYSRALSAEASAHQSLIAAQKAEADARNKAAAAATKAAGQYTLTPDAANRLDRDIAGTEPQRATREVTQAEHALAAATSRREALMNQTFASQAAGERAYNAARAAEVGAQRRLTAAIDRETRARERAATLEGGVRGQFMQGFRGRGDMPYAEQLGQTFKFGLFYGAAYKILFAITQTFQATLQEAIAFQDAMVDLNIATGRSSEANNELAEQLGSISVEGGFTPAEGVQTGARAIGLYGLTEANKREQDLAATMSTRVATQIAAGTGGERTFQDIQADLGAISQAFNLGYEGQTRVADLDAFLSRKFGIAPGSTLQPVAESGAVASLAGFSLEDTMAISANLQSRTGQSASTIGGLLTQIFTRSGEGSLVEVAKKYGIDTRGTTLRQQVEDLSAVYRSADPSQQAEIAASFGRGRSQNVAAVLLGDAPSIFKTAAASIAESLGASEDQFRERMETIGGQLKQLGGQFLEFAHLIGEAGLLDVLGLGVLALQAFFGAINPVLELWNQMPRAIRDVIIGLTALGVATKMGAFTRLGEAVASGGAIAASRPISGAVRGGLGALAGSSMLGIPLPIVAGATAGLVAIASVKSSMDDMQAATGNAVTAVRGFARGKTLGDITSDDLLNQRSLLGTQATELRGSTGLVHNVLTLGNADDAVEGFADTLDAYGRHAQRVARRAEALAETGVEPQSLFESFDAEGIGAGMELVANQGRSAVGQFHALAVALNHSAQAAKRAEREFRPGLTAGQLTQTTFGAITGALPKEFQLSGASSLEVDPRTGYTSSPVIERAELASRLGEFLPPEELESRLKGGIKQLGIKSERGVFKNADELGAIAGQGIAAAVLEGTGATPQQVKRLQTIINRAIARDIRKRTKAVAESLDPNRQLSAEEITQAALALESSTQTQVGNRGETDYGGRVRRAARGVREIRLLHRNQGATTESTNALNRARRFLAEQQINEFEAIRRAQQSNADSQRQVARIGRRFMRREIRAAVRGGHGDALADIVERGGQAAMDAARNAINEALKVARAAARMRVEALEAVATLAEALNPLLALTDVKLPEVSDDPNVRRLLRMRNVLRRTPASPRGKDNEFTHPGDVPGYEPPEEGGGPNERESRRLDRLAARDSAIAAGRGTDVAAARAALADAKRRRDAAKKGSTDYWNAIADVRNSRRDLADALSARGEAKAGGGGGFSADPVEDARDQLRDAQRRLNASKQGSTDYWTALRDVHDAQQALAEAIAARASAARRASIAPDDTIGQARADVADAVAAMRRAPAGSEEYYTAVADRRAAEFAAAEAVGARNSARRRARIAPDDSAALAQADIQDALDAMRRATPNTEAYWTAVGELQNARQSYAQAQNEEADAAAAAEAARGGGQISAARVQIESAVRAMATATDGTAAQSQALEQFYQGQQALQEAVLAYRQNVLLLRGDITNPLHEASVALRIARRKLEQDIAAGRDRDVIAQDRVDVRRAEAERESTMFSQRLERVQTAEQLGRISHQRYIQYLENEQNRLRSIGNRTYQQQQQLNQIDQLLKDAAGTMQGQFNIGDIKLPTPYHVRRYIEQRTEQMLNDRRDVARDVRNGFGEIPRDDFPGPFNNRDIAGQRASVINSNNTTTITINGADIGKVRQVIRDEVGAPARTRTTQTRRR